MQRKIFHERDIENIDLPEVEGFTLKDAAADIEALLKRLHYKGYVSITANGEGYVRISLMDEERFWVKRPGENEYEFFDLNKPQPGDLKRFEG